MPVANLDMGQLMYVPGSPYFAGAGGGDPYTQGLQGAMTQLQQAGVTGPIDITTQMQRRPEADLARYFQTAYGQLPQQIQQLYAGMQAPGYGELPEEQISRYLALAEGPQRQQAQSQINAALAEAGFAPSGTGGIGPQAELMGRFESALRGQQAQQFLANAVRGLSARGVAGMAGAQAGTQALMAGAGPYFAALAQPDIMKASGQAGAAGGGKAMLDPWAVAQRRGDIPQSGGGGGAAGGGGGGGTSGGGAGGGGGYWPFGGSTGTTGWYSGAYNLTPTTGFTGGFGPGGAEIGADTGYTNWGFTGGMGPGGAEVGTQSGWTEGEGVTGGYNPTTMEFSPSGRLNWKASGTPVDIYGLEQDYLSKRGY